MSKNEYKIGNLLNDKNAIMNYIYQDGAKIGVVVGMKGKDRDNPLVGWCLFSEFEEVDNSIEVLPLKKVEYLRDNLKRIEMAIESSPHFSELAKAEFDLIKNLNVIVNKNSYSSEVLYLSIENALLRANPNRENFFVSSNPMYCQNTSLLKTTSNHRCHIDTLISDYHIYDEAIITKVRKAARAMEWRCYRYFKDCEKTKNDNN